MKNPLEALDTRKNGALQRSAERIRSGEPPGLVIYQEASAVNMWPGDLSKQLRDASPARKKKKWQSTVPEYMRKFNEEN